MTLLSILCLIVLSTLTFAQEPASVTAEPVGQANLRATTDVSSELLGEITAGTRYPVLGRSQFYPWLLLGDPATQQPIGWVFETLLVVQGDLSSVPFSTLVVDPSATPPTPPPTAAEQVEAPPLGSPTATATATATPGSPVVGVVRGEINIRYGPGVDYPRIGIASDGQRFDVLMWHTQFPWVQVSYPDAPNGIGWIAIDLLEFEGNLYNLPSTSQTQFALPTLTPTPPAVLSSGFLRGAEVPLSPGFAILADSIWDRFLDARFDPLTRRFGAFFLMDLQTGESITFGNDIAFSGTSINKVAILARLYATLDAPASSRVATDIANTMICSENVSTNRLLEVIGGGDEFVGAQEVTMFLRQLGMQNTFLTAPFTIDPANPPYLSRPIEYPQTPADQTKANPDLSNQLTVDEMGWLLASMYQCAYNESGPLIELFPGQYEPRECRHMLHVMSNNTVDGLLKAGVPEGTRVAHKHGWINDTHGNAGVFFTPGGDYVMVIMMHQPDWLEFQGDLGSLPVMAEVSRSVYNYYNPDAPLDEIREGFIPEAPTCNFAGTPLIADLMQEIWDE